MVALDYRSPELPSTLQFLVEYTALAENVNDDAVTVAREVLDDVPVRPHDDHVVVPRADQSRCGKLPDLVVGHVRRRVTVLVDGHGQSFTADPFGRIVEEKLSQDVDYICGEAAAAYEGRLKRFRRSVVFVKPDWIVIYDDLEAIQPVIFQFLLHALGPFSLDEENARITLERPKAGVVAQYLSPMALRLRQWEGYDPPPYRNRTGEKKRQVSTPAGYGPVEIEHRDSALHDSLS